MDRNKTKFLLDKYLAGNCTREEKLLVESWLEKAGTEDREWSEMTPEARDRYRSSLYRDIGRTAGWQKKGRQKKYREKNQGKKPFYFVFGRAAAAILLLAGFSFLLYYFGGALFGPSGTARTADSHFSRDTAPRPVPAAYVSSSVPVGKTRKLELSDGTAVWLNAASSLRYPERFEPERREVFLEGEAFFQVTPEKDRPFIIHTGDMQTYVVGTSFNVRAYRGEKEIRVVVATGKVEVSLPGGEGDDQKKLLLPNQMATYVKSAERITSEAISDAGAYRAWTEGKLVFDHSPMEEVAATLERALGLDIDIKTPEVNACEITGSFHRDQEAAITMEAICKSIDAKYTLRNGRVTISGPGCK